ncbi:hypothetical protein LOTGIDRAFT_120462 [Lottia gigantea]|uniref:Very-long-chain (3R)-3-hydroxyacyl-CoA dehydratase n=1 Tax=Lottia gigantea TaxID=225164 RepID=V4ABR2_LOTGI|nr:hypothetical protein LOTGIDRAFT_120462 [Lottia gigantea]ESO92520.1 hypothetical protein LOTGIDRAFT_120462 [Lottia gigantea]
MAEFLSPFVFWGQNSKSVSLRVDLRDVKNETVNIDENSIQFDATAVGLKGNHKYKFDIDFYLPVDPKESSYKVTEKCVEFELKKEGEDEVWPRLTEKQVKLPWLKIDFDKFQLEDDSDNENKNVSTTKFFKSSLKKMRRRKRSGNIKPFDFKLTYTLLYNLFQFVGFLFIFVKLQYQYYQHGEEAKKIAFEDVGSQIMLCQIIAVLEIIHPMIGLVKTGWIAPLAQVFGINFILFVLIFQEQQLQHAPVTWYLFTVWSFIELVRYPYYMLSSANIDIGLLTWLRYTLWIPLYPIGFLLEGNNELSYFSNAILR